MNLLLFNKSPLHPVLSQVNLGSIPLCCIAGFPGTKLDLNPQSFSMVRRCNFWTKAHLRDLCYNSSRLSFPACVFSRLVNQVPITQFTILYILMRWDTRIISRRSKLQIFKRLIFFSCELSKVDPTTTMYTFLTTLQVLLFLCVFDMISPFKHYDVVVCYKSWIFIEPPRIILLHVRS